MERRKGEIHYYSEMEVVRLTTTAAKTTPSDTTDEPTKAETLKAKVALKARTALRQNIFGFIVVIASIVAMVVLMILGLALDNPKFQYPDAMQKVVTIFVIGIFAWPAINAVRLRKNGGMWPRLAVVIAAVLGSLLLPLLLRIAGMTGFAESAWRFLGVFQAIAMFLLIALAAILIEKHTKDSDELVKARGDLKETDEAIVNTGSDIRKSEALVASAEPRITPLKQDVKDKEEALEAAERTQQAAEEAYSKSQLEQYKSEKDRLEKKLKRLAKDLEETYASTPKPGLAARTALTNKRAGIQAETAATEEAIDTIDQALKSKAVLDEADRLARSLKSAKSALNDAKTAKNNADTALTSANLALSDARQAVETHKGAKKELEKEKERLVELISSAEKSAKLVWRDTLFLPMLCLVFALVFSASWYGSVLVERF